MDLNISALAAACLVEEIREASGVSSVVDDQLDAIDRDSEWLDDLAAFFRNRWDEEHPDGCEPTLLSLPWVPDEFAYLLSWCLAPCSRDSALPSPASLQPGPKIHLAVAPVGGDWTHPSLRIGVYGWAVGRGIAEVNVTYPALLPLGENVDQVPVPVYEGLLEYVRDAGSGPWSEMTTSAVVWRLGALGQAIAHKPVQASIEDLITLSAAAGARPRSIYGSWAGLVTGARNGFTHVHADAPGDMTFLDAVDLYPSEDAVFPHLELATAGMGRMVTTSLLSVPPDRAEAWADLLDDARSWI